jgi:hypothetical protein
MKPYTGRAHEWGKYLKHTHFPNLESCKFCGIVRNKNNEGAMNCPGVVRITTRKATK